MTTRERRTYFDRLCTMREAYAHLDAADRAGITPITEAIAAAEQELDRIAAEADSQPPADARRRAPSPRSDAEGVNPRLRAPSRCGPASASRRRRTCPCRGPWPRTSRRPPGRAPPGRRSHAPSRVARSERDADRSVDDDRPPAELDRPPELPEDPLRSRGRLLVGDDVDQQDRELVAALAADDVALADRASQALGHPAQDLVAGHVAEGVVDGLEVVEVHEDVIGRQSGDEFAVLLAQVRDADEAIVTADRILGELRRPILLGAHSIVVGGTIGIAVATEPGATAEDLLTQADAAMYAAKADGKGPFAFFDPRMPARGWTDSRRPADLCVPLDRQDQGGDCSRRWRRLRQRSARAPVRCGDRIRDRHAGAVGLVKAACTPLALRSSRSRQPTAPGS